MNAATNPNEQIDLKTRQTNLIRILRKAMADLDINQSQLADRTGVRPTTISAWMKGSQMPDEINRKKLAAAIGYTIDRLDAEINGMPMSKPVMGLLEAIDFAKNCAPQEFAILVDEGVYPRIARMLAVNS